MTLPADLNARVAARVKDPKDEVIKAQADALLSKERVPVLGAKGLTIPRSVWDEAWIGYCKEYGGSGSQSQHERLLQQGFWVSELDHFVPNWRPISAERNSLAAELERAVERADKLEKERDEARALVREPWAEIDRKLALERSTNAALLAQHRRAEERIAALRRHVMYQRYVDAAAKEAAEEALATDDAAAKDGRPE